MDHEQLAVLAAIDASGIGLQVEFHTHGRRIAHRILAVIGGQTIPLLDSREGDDCEPFPPSPPLQQVAVEPRADGTRVALLVGMAARSHWSVSVEELSSQRTLRFDVACRSTAAQCEQLGSSYRAAGSWQPLTAQGGLQCPVRTDCIAKILGCADPEALCQVSGTAAMVSAQPTGRSRNATWRWRYDVVLEPLAILGVT